LPVKHGVEKYRRKKRERKNLDGGSTRCTVDQSELAEIAAL
jgi:hypothetical protein